MIFCIDVQPTLPPIVHPSAKRTFIWLACLLLHEFGATSKHVAMLLTTETCLCFIPLFFMLVYHNVNTFNKTYASVKHMFTPFS